MGEEEIVLPLGDVVGELVEKREPDPIRYPVLADDVDAADLRLLAAVEGEMRRDERLSRCGDKRAVALVEPFRLDAPFAGLRLAALEAHPEHLHRIGERLLGDLPEDIRGTSRIRRGKKVIFEQPFLTGEANMSHSIANLEAHHFKYGYFRRPGDVHIHTFGTATLSFAAGIKPKDGDVFEIEAREFGLPLRNPLEVGAKEKVAVQAL